MTVLERADGRVRLLVDEQIDLDGLLERARAAGEVVRFSYEPPRLSELFMEAVAEAPPAGATTAGTPSELGASAGRAAGGTRQ